jgi:ankyrin repeat protein
MLACGNGHLRIVELLLERGADIEDQDGDGQTALIIACKKGRGDVVRLLVAAADYLDAEDAQVAAALSISSKAVQDAIFAGLEDVAAKGHVLK